MSSFYEIMTNIDEMPGLYGVNKVEDIYFILLGRTLFCPNLNDDNDFQTNFRVFVNNHFNTIKDNHDWYKLIRLYSGSDKHSIELFSSLFRQYIHANSR